MKPVIDMAVIGLLMIILFLGITVSVAKADHVGTLDEINDYCVEVVQNHAIVGPITTKILFCNVDYGKDDSVMILSSLGGEIVPAILVADRMSINGTKVLVTDFCMSACVNILSGAETRYACDGALIGVHQANSADATMAILFHLQTDWRISDEVLDIISYTTTENISVFDANKAVEFGLIDYVVNCEDL